MQILERIVKILSSFSHENPELGLNEITRESGLPKPTVYRIVEALCEYKFLVKNKQKLTYRIGVKFFELGSIYMSSLELREIAFPYIDQLQHETGESVHLGILEDLEVVSIEAMESSQSLRAKVWTGKRAPLYCTSIGKVLLAFQPLARQSEIVSEITFEKFTKNTIGGSSELMDELTRIKSRGYAIDDSEHDEGVFCIAAPIFDSTGSIISSLSVSGPESRMKNNYREEYIPLLLNITKEISNKMGFFERK